jgi:hypothetical protein
MMDATVVSVPKTTMPITSSDDDDQSTLDLSKRTTIYQQQQEEKEHQNVVNEKNCDDEDSDQDDDEVYDDEDLTTSSSNGLTFWPTIKLIVAATFAISAIQMLRDGSNSSRITFGNNITETATATYRDMSNDYSWQQQEQRRRRRLSEVDIDNTNPLGEMNPPLYMKSVFNDLKERNKLFDDTPPEEVKYWFEYTGPLQVCFICLCVRLCFKLLFIVV